MVQRCAALSIPCCDVSSLRQQQSRGEGQRCSLLAAGQVSSVSAERILSADTEAYLSQQSCYFSVVAFLRSLVQGYGA